MLLTGSLESFRLGDVLRLIAESGVTGRVDIDAHGSRGSIFLRDRHVVDARIEDVHGGDAIDAVLDMLRREQGTFVFEREDHAASHLDVDVDELIALVDLREVECRAAAESLGSLERPVRLRTQIASEEVTITAGHWRLLALVDGRRSARDIVEQAGQGSSRGLIGLAELASVGLVSTEPEPPAAAEPATIVLPDPEEDGGELTDSPEGQTSDLDPAQLLRELGSDAPATRLSRRGRIPTREEQRLRLRN